MRAATVTTLDGPTKVEVREHDEPGADGPFGPQLLIDVHAVGVSWPDLLLTKGEYQVKPQPPFILGVDYAGVVRADAEGFKAGQRVAGVLPYGAGAEVVASGKDSVFPLPDELSFEQGAALGMNYLTADFALADRAGLNEGETVLVHGAAGGVGTATIQVAKGMGARVIAVASTEEKREVAKSVGADEAIGVEGFLNAVKVLTDGTGVDVVMDVVGGDLMTDSLRSLAPLGRLLVVGFTGGAIPQVKVNRLLLNNIDVRGVGWGAYAMTRPGFMTRQWERLMPMMTHGTIAPPVHDVRPLEEFGEALTAMQERRLLGKTVLTVR